MRKERESEIETNRQGERVGGRWKRWEKRGGEGERYGKGESEEGSHR